MSDIFDQLEVADKPAGDIFDTIAPTSTIQEEPRDVFDEISPAPIDQSEPQDIFDTIAPAQPNTQLQPPQTPFLEEAKTRIGEGLEAGKAMAESITASAWDIVPSWYRGVKGALSQWEEQRRKVEEQYGEFLESEGIEGVSPTGKVDAFLEEVKENPFFQQMFETPNRFAEESQEVEQQAAAELRRIGERHGKTAVAVNELNKAIVDTTTFLATMRLANMNLGATPAQAATDQMGKQMLARLKQAGKFGVFKALTSEADSLDERAKIGAISSMYMSTPAASGVFERQKDVFIADLILNSAITAPQIKELWDDPEMDTFDKVLESIKMVGADIAFSAMTRTMRDTKLSPENKRMQEQGQKLLQAREQLPPEQRAGFDAAVEQGITPAKEPSPEKPDAQKLIDEARTVPEGDIEASQLSKPTEVRDGTDTKERTAEVKAEQAGEAKEVQGQEAREIVPELGEAKDAQVEGRTPEQSFDSDGVIPVKRSGPYMDWRGGVYFSADRGAKTGYEKRGKTELAIVEPKNPLVVDALGSPSAGTAAIKSIKGEKFFDSIEPADDKQMKMLLEGSGISAERASAIIAQEYDLVSNRLDEYGAQLAKNNGHDSIIARFIRGNGNINEVVALDQNIVTQAPAKDAQVEGAPKEAPTQEAPRGDQEPVSAEKVVPFEEYSRKQKARFVTPEAEGVVDEMRRHHRSIIQQAILRGENIPENILADYPDLKPSILAEKVAPEAREGAPEPITTPSGLDKTSPRQEIRDAFLEAGGMKENRSKSGMLKFLNGTPSTVPTASIIKEINELGNRSEKGKLFQALDFLNKKNAGRRSMYDLLNTISRGVEDSSIRGLTDELNRSDVAEKRTKQELEEITTRMNPKGKYSDPIAKTSVKVDTPIGKKKFKLGEIFMLEAALTNPEHKKTLLNNRYGSSSAFDDRTFKASEAQYNKMIESAKSGLDPKTIEAYDRMMEVYEAMVQEFGVKIKPVADKIMAGRGIDREFNPVEGKWVPIMRVQDSKKAPMLTVDLPDGGTMEVRDTFANREIHKGRFKERTGGGKVAVIRVGTLEEMLPRLMNETAEFVGRGEVNDKISKVLNNDQLKNAIRDNIGQGFMKILKEKSQQTTGDLQVSRRDISDRAMSAMFKAADTWRLSRLSTKAIMRASSQMIRPYLHDKKSYALGATHILDPFITKMKRQDPVYKDRYSGGAYTPELVEQGTGLKTASGGLTKGAVAQNLTSEGDRVAISEIFATSAFDALAKRGEAMTVENLKKYESDKQFWDDVSNDVNAHIIRTQPSGSAAAVSTWKGRSRDKLFWRLATRYGSQGQRIHNNVLEASEQYAYNPTPENRKHLGEVMESMLLTNTAILATVKGSRRWLKRLALLGVAGSFMSDADREELEEELAQEQADIPKNIATQAGRNIVRNVEFADDLLTLYDYASKKYVDEPFSSIAGSEMDEMKEAVMAYKTASTWANALDERVNADGTPMSQRQYQLAMKRYEDAITRAMKKTVNTAMFVSRIPGASMSDIDVLERKAAEKITEKRFD